MENTDKLKDLIKDKYSPEVDAVTFAKTLHNGLIFGFKDGDDPINERYSIDTIYSAVKSKYTDQTRLKEEILSKMKGTFELTPFIPAVKDMDTGEVTGEVLATYFELTTKKALEKSIESEWISGEDAVDNLQGELSWSEFKKSI